MDWDNPEERAALIYRVGRERYNELQREHIEASVVATVGGYHIRPVRSQRFGQVFMVDGANKGFSTQAEAEQWAHEHPQAP